MSVKTLREMMEFLRTNVKAYCRECAPLPLYEAESLAFMLGLTAYNLFGGKTVDEQQFRMTVEHFVRKEIERVCA